MICKRKPLLPAYLLKAIAEAVERNESDELFPRGCSRTRDVADMIRAGKFASLSRARMEALVAAGTDPTSLTAAQLLPGVMPGKLLVTEAYYAAY